MFLHVKKGVLGILCGCVLILGISGSAILSARDVGESVDKVDFNVSGLMPAALTALRNNNSVDLDGIPKYVDYLIGKGLRSVLVGGSSGEHMFLSVNDRKSIIDAWVKASRGKDFHIQVQIGGAPFADVLDLADYCSHIDVGSILTLPDLYQRPKTVEKLVSYMELVAKAAPNLPVFYYHIPKKSLVDVSMPEFVKAASAQISNFKGIKFTATNLAEASQVLNVLQGDQKIFLGGEVLLAPAALLGIESCQSPAINLFPELFNDILDSIKNGHVQRARKVQQMLTSIVAEISAQGGRIPALKVAFEMMTGIEMGPPALPAHPVTTDQRRRIADALKLN